MERATAEAIGVGVAAKCNGIEVGNLCVGKPQWSLVVSGAKQDLQPTMPRSWQCLGLRNAGRIERSNADCESHCGWGKYAAIQCHRRIIASATGEYRAFISPLPGGRIGCASSNVPTEDGTQQLDL